ncbi:hypothetical protein MJO29_016755 [Puccinia striiformis f. sp. tritici]|nr:hypothetical protein MJO29_016755 [Puccinia striiformis f. sp. tritici]
MSNTRSTGQSLLPIVDPEALLRTAAAERRCLAKILANSSDPSVHVPTPLPKALPSTSIHVPSPSYPSTSFHTPATSPPGTPADPSAEHPFTPSLLRTNLMADLPNNSLPGGNDPPKDPAPPKKTDSPKGGPSSSKSQPCNSKRSDSSTSNSATPTESASHGSKTPFSTLSPNRRKKKAAHLTPAPKSDRLDLQKFRIADGPSFKGTLHDIEPFLKWITQLQIFFSTKGVTNDDDKICVAGGLLKNTMLLDFYVAEGPTFTGKSWNEFKTRLFEVALPQRWRTTLKTKLRQLTMGPKETFIAFSGRARTLQTLINFDDTSLSSPTPSPPTTQLSDFDLAEFVVLGVSEELRSDIAKFAVLDADPFTYPAFEKRVAVFDENTVRQPPPCASRGTPSHHSPSNSPPDPVAWRVHAYLDSQGQCHHCKTTCRSTPGTCTKPLNKKWVDIPDTFQTPRRPTDYKPPQAHGASTSTAGKPTHPPAGRPPLGAASPAVVTESETHHQHGPGPEYTNVVEAMEVDHQVFVDAVADNSLPPDLTPSDWATFKEIDDILSDNVANVEEEEYVPLLPSTPPSPPDYGSRPGGCFTGRRCATRRTAPTLVGTLLTTLLRHLKLPTLYSRLLPAPLRPLQTRQAPLHRSTYATIAYPPGLDSSPAHRNSSSQFPPGLHPVHPSSPRNNDSLAIVNNRNSHLLSVLESHGAATVASQFTGSQFPSGTTPGPQNSTPNFNRPAAFGS